MKSNLKTSNMRAVLKQHDAISKLNINQFQQSSCGATRNLFSLQTEELVFSEISSVARREDQSIFQESQFTPRQEIQESSPSFTVNSSVFGDSIQQQCQASQLSSSMLDLSIIEEPKHNEVLSDPCLQFASSRLIKQYKSQNQLKKLQKPKKSYKKQHDEPKLKTIELRNRLRSVKNWMEEGKFKKNKKCTHFKKTDIFDNLMTMKKKDNEEKRRKKQHIQYLKQHPPSKLAYYKQLINQEGISYQQAKILVDSIFPYLQKKNEDLMLNRTITNQEISKNGLQLLKKIRSGNLGKKILKSEDIGTHIFETIADQAQKVLFQRIQCFIPNQRQSIKQQESSSEQNDNEKRLRKFRRIFSEMKQSDSKAKQTQNQLNSQRQIYPKRSANDLKKNCYQQNEKMTKKMKLSQNYYFTSGIDSESDTRTTPWSKNQFKSLSKLNSETALQPISQVDHSVQESFRQL